MEIFYGSPRRLILIYYTVPLFIYSSKPAIELEVIIEVDNDKKGAQGDL